MKTTSEWIAVGALVLVGVTAALPVSAGQKTEDQLIAELASPNAEKVTIALQQLEKAYPTSTKAQPEIKKLLTDNRDKVRRKAARVLGALHAEVSSADIQAISALLQSKNPDEVIDGLKALRGLKAQEAIPKITPLLKTPGLHKNVVRDACRTLAVLGDKSLIPQIEPLLTHPDDGVKKDAQDAIYALKAKP